MPCHGPPRLETASGNYSTVHHFIYCDPLIGAFEFEPLQYCDAVSAIAEASIFRAFEPKQHDINSIAQKPTHRMSYD
jgi:hypothetical protein